MVLSEIVVEEMVVVVVVVVVVVAVVVVFENLRIFECFVVAMMRIVCCHVFPTKSHLFPQ